MGIMKAIRAYRTKKCLDALGIDKECLADTYANGRVQEQDSTVIVVALGQSDRNALIAAFNEVSQVLFDNGASIELIFPPFLVATYAHTPDSTASPSDWCGRVFRILVDRHGGLVKVAYAADGWYQCVAGCKDRFALCVYYPHMVELMSLLSQTAFGQIRKLEPPQPPPAK